jgi:hypothetical protein
MKGAAGGGGPDAEPAFGDQRATCGQQAVLHHFAPGQLRVDDFHPVQTGTLPLTFDIVPDHCRLHP